MLYRQHEGLLSAGQAIRLRGRNLTETDEVKLGAYHTLELEPQRAFTLAKVRSGIPPVTKNSDMQTMGSLSHLGVARCIVTEESLSTLYCDPRARWLGEAQCHDTGLHQELRAQPARGGPGSVGCVGHRAHKDRVRPGRVRRPGRCAHHGANLTAYIRFRVYTETSRCDALPWVAGGPWLKL